MRAWWKTLLQDARLYDALLAQRRRAVCARWNMDARPVPPPPEVKQAMVARLARKYSVDILVETGTYMGSMIMAQRRLFKRIVSIELSKELHDRAALLFQNWPQISLVHGDSASALPQVLSELRGQEPILFWLDGHWSDGITARADRETPVVAEIQAILSREATRDVILIDDARLFTGTNDYPTVSEVESLIRSSRPSYELGVKDDVLTALPPTIAKTGVGRGTL